MAPSLKLMLTTWLAAVLIAGTVTLTLPAPAFSVEPSRPASTTLVDLDINDVFLGEGPHLEFNPEGHEASEATVGPLNTPELIALGEPEDRTARQREDGNPIAAVEVSPSVAATQIISAESFAMLGVTWPGGQDAAAHYAVRTLGEAGWSGWFEIFASDHSGDNGQLETSQGRSGTDPLWVGESTAFQIAVLNPGEAAQGLQLVIVDPGEGPEGAGVSTHSAGQPSIVPRAAWGANESLRDVHCAGYDWPEYSAEIRLAAVHHTASSNNYNSQAEAMAQIRGFQQYHVYGRGWCDIGYNFLVDKWGTIYEGRAGGVDKAVIGVHIGGFNTGSVGVAMIGDYSSVGVSSALRESVARILAWRLGAYQRDPYGSVTITTAGGENSRYPAGSTVTLPMIIGHRDVGTTSCPGQAGYDNLPWIRDRVRALIGTTFYSTPGVREVQYGENLVVNATVAGTINWTGKLFDRLSGTEIASIAGGTANAGTFTLNVSPAHAGGVIGAGRYRVTITGTDASNGQPVQPFTTYFDVLGSGDPPPVTPVPLVPNLEYVPIDPARLVDTRHIFAGLGKDGRLDVVAAGVSGIPANAAAVALNVTSVNSNTRTHFSVWPAGLPRPHTSVLNVSGGRTVASHVVVGVGGEGKVSLYNAVGYSHVVVDAVGYFVQSGGSGYGATTQPTRVFDSRTGHGQLSDGQSVVIPVSGVAGVPEDATAVVVNVTAANTNAAGHFSASAPAAVRPATSVVNFDRATAAANRAIIEVGDGAIQVWSTGAKADLVVDIVGWYGPSGPGRVTPIEPVRAFDTRYSGGPVGPRAVRDFGVSAEGVIPADATALLMVLTSTGQTTATHATVWKTGAPRPGTSDLNSQRTTDRANMAYVAIDSLRRISVRNEAGSAHMIGDIYAYVTEAD